VTSAPWRASLSSLLLPIASGNKVNERKRRDFVVHGVDLWALRAFARRR